MLATVATGTVSAAIATCALVALARAEGKGALQPLAATSHILHGPSAGRRRKADLAHAGLGLATDHAAAIFWAAPLTVWLARRPRRSAAETFAAGAATAGIAAVVDYGLIPRRYSPGWEHAVSHRAVGATFAALGLGLGLGAWLTRSLRD